MSTPPPFPTKNVASRSGCFALLLTVLGLLLLTLIVSFFTPSKPIPQAVSTPVELDISRDKSPPKPADSPSLLPGLSPVDIYLNLESKGFKTRRVYGDIQNEFICELKEPFASYNVTIFTPPGQPSKVRSVSITAVNSGDPTGRVEAERKAFLGYIATTPYTGSTPEAAQRWVQENYNTRAEKAFGGVQFQLSASERATVLRLSPVKSNTP